ncbi:glycosyl hydrolase 115 family protein [Paradesertivirga mongoliensis]|uniref:Glycosyl hydrolase 115 family protein n=1 Tax=Paradesertivirga mongoliensis TaxID=2100740 RepID=A0ABW4ZK45_9SPHI|nr:glycosyl hydrolase 115 family protein [Pedobacter mongoliensis]
MKKQKLSLIIIFSCICLTVNGQIQISNKALVGAFPLVAASGAVSQVLSDASDAEVVRIAAQALKDDIKLVTGISTRTSTSSIQVWIGTIGKSPRIDKLISSKKLRVDNIKGKWETFSISLLNNPAPNVKQALVIAGSDPRGTAFGVFELSKLIGVSPFYWWADVNPKQQKEIYIKGSYVSKQPSVKFRGIFLNDEDWGLQPWAAKTFEPKTGDIGPKTYAKIFELLLRLKANLIWPAMHPSTKAFYHYAGNPKVAADYAIVVGSSHAEPMLRNNVGEWDKSMGAFNYITNKEKIYNYWESRVKESKGNDAIYTLGMRGVHDSGMEGVKSIQEAVPLLERIIDEQRGMLKKHINANVASIPQAFTVYKEVLDIYNKNIKLADDITVVWPDDNYGYIHRLNSEKENKRSGGSGVYYHASYWGRPHDYLWLSSTHPGLLREEMMKAYETKSDRLWVLNVGDIKPLEYNIQMFMDMAYQAEPFKNSSYTRSHLKNWAGEVFGADKADKVADILWKYYQLAFERRPEFMGWSQTEPTTQTKYSDYNHFFYGDEAQRRIDSYNQLVSEVSSLRPQISSKDADAFYQLVYYPVVGASLMNKKFLYRDKAFLYAKQNRASASDYAAWSKQAYDDIVKETEYYNNQLAGGKWKHMMSMEPRDLPVYKEPVLPELFVDKNQVWGIAPEGFVTKDSSLTGNGSAFSLPAFNRLSDKKYFIDIFLSDDKTLNWTAQKDDWIKLSQSSGTLNPQTGKREARLWVSVDWTKIPRSGRQNGKISFSADGKTLEVNVGANNSIPSQLASFKGFVEDNGYVSMHASNFSRESKKQNLSWTAVDGLGHTDKALMASPLEGVIIPALQNPEDLKSTAPFVEYDFYALSPATPQLYVYTLPTHPINTDYKMRYAVSIDNGPIKIVDFTTVGRSEEWKQNVLRNSAIRSIKTEAISPGKHTLKVYMIDPGVVLDRIIIDLGGFKKAYSTVAETKK